jgi:hypothetical protein
VRAVLAETLRLFGTNLYLLTLLSLTVWLPGHVLVHYQEFFEPGEGGPARFLRTGLVIQALFDPLVVGATLAALGRLAEGRPVEYATALLAGVRCWARLAVFRALVVCVLSVPVAVGLALGRSPSPNLLAGAVVLGLTIAVGVLLLRVAVADSVLVFEGTTVLGAIPRATALTAGRRLRILGVLLVLLAGVLSLAVGAGLALRMLPALNHFVVRVLIDCALSTGQSVFTVASFVIYRRALATAPASTAPQATR